MTNDALTVRAAEHMEALCTRYRDRHVGGDGNREATALFANVCREHGWDVSVTEFDATAWERDGADLIAGTDSFEVHPGPYSLPLDVTAKLVSVETVEALEAGVADGSLEGTILLLHGPIATDQLMPKNFVFYNPDEHKRIIAGFEGAMPLGIIAASGKHPMTSSVCPFPVIEDGDFDIPNAYMKDVDGAELLTYVGRDVHLTIRSGRITKQGQHVVARKPGASSEAGRVVIFGHIDTREDTPGAIDNATGAASMMIAAELLGEYAGGLTIEMVPLNGEDYYAAPGQMIWVGENEGLMDDIVLGMNTDGAGYAGAATAVSTYGAPAEIERIARQAIVARASFEAGPQWFESDHSIITQGGRPALAITTADFREVWPEYAHTTRDTIDIIDPAIVAEVGRFYADIIARLDEMDDA